jgi:cytochrome c oxidase cbb3-type subunit III
MALRFVAAAALLVLLIGAASGQEPPPPSVRYPAHVEAGGNPPPAGTLENPARGDARAAKDGEKLFSVFNCDGCHGLGATGAVGPSLADGRWRYGATDGAVFQSIYYGRPRGMPAFGGILPAAAIWKLVTYLRSLEPKTDSSTVRWSK